MKLALMLRRQSRPTATELGLARRFASAEHAASRSDPLVSVQCASDSLFHFAMFGQIVQSLRARRALRCEQVVTHSVNLGEAKSLAAFAFHRWLGRLLIRRWQALFASFCDSVAYRSVSGHPLRDLIDLRRAYRLLRSLDSRAALTTLQIDGIVVGDLINDSFLRFRPAPRVDLTDRYLFVCIWQACRDVRRARRYFARERPRLYFTSYSSYVQHGIAVRAALQAGVHVYSFGNVQEFTKRLTASDWVHTKNPDLYAVGFEQLTDQESRLQVADAALGGRLAGVADGATAYMRRSAYEESGAEVPDVSGAVVVFLHDFFDSPHIYREMVFPDFWDWACFTIETLREAGIPFFLKPHPNQISLSDGALDALRRRFPELRMIPSGVTNTRLVAAGMTWAVTVYGSIAHEMAYLGVPTVACARHPHISFDFCRTASSREQYGQFLRDCATPVNGHDAARLKTQGLAFYYMHNLNIDEQQRMLRDAAWNLFWACNAGADGERVLEGLRNIAAMPAFARQIDEWSRALDER